MTSIKLTDKEKERYSRHLRLNKFTEEEQIKLKNSKILVIGAGGLASPLLLYLAASGIGNIEIIDFDFVDITNLQRQIIHKENNIGKNKAISAKESMKALNSFINITVNQNKFSESNCDIIKNFNIIAVTVDDYKTRTLANKVAIKYQVPQVAAGVVGYEGWLSTFKSNVNLPCYNCFHHNLNPNSLKLAKDIGVFAPLVGILGTMQGAEIIREILGFKNGLEGKLRVIDFLTNTTTDYKMQKSKDCLICNINLNQQ